RMRLWLMSASDCVSVMSEWVRFESMRRAETHRLESNVPVLELFTKHRFHIHCIAFSYALADTNARPSMCFQAAIVSRFE
ncbi:hypothetical protein, partial [Paraburkholderia sp.]|uniref:hypothetical protein n=1 Tax=Paraburkholderia sp. TaxID=1926495 RepID=UPI00286F47AA